MRIGLVRHFKVDIDHKIFMTSEEYNEYAERYNISGVITNEVDLNGFKWDKCYCSDYKRAIITAKTIYKGDITITEKLREIPTAARFNSSLPIHYALWDVMSRLAWFKNHKSQPETHTYTLARINTFLDEVMAASNKEDNILIVSHAALMFFMRVEIIRRGFKGDKFLKAKNGYLYLFEKL